MKKYENAVKCLVELANKSCGSSRAAAAVLLSAYNPIEYPLDITELCLFDSDYFAAAMLVISLRVWNGKAPHLLLGDGNEVFVRLSSRWRDDLHIHARVASHHLQR